MEDAARWADDQAADLGAGVDPSALVAALEKAGWARSGGRAGAYVRLRWPDALWNRDASLTVPLDSTAGDYADLLQAALRELALADARGQAARQVLAGIGRS